MVTSETVDINIKSTQDAKILFNILKSHFKKETTITNISRSKNVLFIKYDDKYKRKISDYY